MGPAISVLLGMTCGEVLWALLLRAVIPILPLSAIWRARLWRWGIALAVTYALMMIIVAVNLATSS